MKLVKMNTDHYVIVDDSEIKEGDWYYLPRTNSPYQCKEDPTELNLERQFGVAKITHSTNILTNGMGILYLSEVKELIGEVDVEKKAKDFIYKQTKIEFGEIHNAPHRVRSYIEGYSQAIEDNKHLIKRPTKWEVEFDSNGKLKLV